MGASLRMRRRVQDEGLRVVNCCQVGRIPGPLIRGSVDGTIRGSHGQLRASSRGKTEVASVARNHWV